MMCPISIALLSILTISFQGFAIIVTEDKSHWFKLGKDDIEAALHIEIVKKPAKNVILFVGDGLGPTTLTASRIYSKTEKGYLSFEKFPHIGALKTYSANKLVPDSCSTATALFCGVKANQKTSGVDASVKLDDCQASLRPEAQTESLLKWAQDVHKSTGFVTTTRVTHATPSALYAHTPNRKWECEATVPDAGRNCKDIARQLIEDTPGRDINVIMGGGRQCLVSNVTSTPADPVDTWACYSGDGRDLITTWKVDKIGRNASFAVAGNSAELAAVSPLQEFVLGIFANGHLKFDYERDRGAAGMPSLAEMTAKAIEILSHRQQGFVLVVEGGLIDQAHHRGHARKALDETVRFSEAIAIATRLTSIEDTLIVVTSDHAHSLVFGGYPGRHEGVLGATDRSKIDRTPYTSLLYGSGGPNNYQFTVDEGRVLRESPANNRTDDFEYSQQAVVLNDEVTHSGSDVLVYAKGPMAHLFHSVHEQTYVAYAIAYAAKIGPFVEKANSSNKKFLFISVNCLLPLIILFVICVGFK